MAGQLSQEVKAEPNLTPILDMVFQLITFFMLVINFKSAEMDLSLKLPVVGSARPVETHGQRGLLVLNIDQHGQPEDLRRDRQNIEAYIAAKPMPRGWPRTSTPTIRRPAGLPTTVVIRADRATPFKMINRVIKACQDNGFRKFRPEGHEQGSLTMAEKTKAAQPVGRRVEPGRHARHGVPVAHVLHSHLPAGAGRRADFAAAAAAPGGGGGQGRPKGRRGHQQQIPSRASTR